MKIIDGTIASPEGFTADGVHAGFKKEKLDFGWIVSKVPASVAGVYTTNQVIAAPLLVTKQSIATKQQMQAIVVNSGVANSCTGQKGFEDALFMQEASANQLGIEKDLVGIASTGVIGEFLPLQTVASGLKQLDLDGHAEQFAQAILTTDTGTKTITVQEEIFGSTVTMSGVAKGSGMIHPNMATMLAYVATDALIEKDKLQDVLKAVTEETFNCITVDGDTSTNDSLVVMATGNSGIYVGGDALPMFQAALQEVCLYLAQAIVRDGEGATKFISIDVQGALNRAEARIIGNTVALSPLVKTALFASDPNWGRILAAVGRSPIDNLDVGRVTIWLGETLLIEDGEPAPTYHEELGQVEMKRDEILIRIDLGRGDASATTWTCDFSYDYVKINAEYRS